MPPKRILIVDDAMELGRVLSAAVETLEAGLVVRVVPSAEEAILDIIRHPVDLLVADVRLPGMSGFDLVRRLRKRTKSPDMKVIIITGWNERGLEEEAAQVEADAFMRKPLNMGEFLDTVTSLLGLQVQQPVWGGQTSEAGNRRPETSLAQLLTRLRQELGALGVVLVNEVGKAVAQAGDLPEGDFENTWSPLLLSALSHCGKVSRQLGNEMPNSALAFKGQPYDLLLAPVGELALALWLKSDRSALRLPLAVEEVLKVQQEVARALEQMGVSLFVSQPKPAAEKEAEAAPTVENAQVVQAEAVAEVPVSPEDVAELDALFAQKESLAGMDVNAFWESAIEPSNAGLNNPDVLTYEQARRLGLAPEHEDKVSPV